MPADRSRFALRGRRLRNRCAAVPGACPRRPGVAVDPRNKARIALLWPLHPPETCAVFSAPSTQVAYFTPANVRITASRECEPELFEAGDVEIKITFTVCATSHLSANAAPNLPAQP